nr:transcriptional regulator [Neobacillus sp. 179.-C4.2 HS]MDP5194207.1 transcriptional regulator [Neobacillus sp. 179.-C4.2 HS]
MVMSFKRKSKFGKWIDEQKGVNTFELVRVSKLSKSTILKLCYDQDYRPRFSTIIKINQGLKKLGKEIDINEFFL